MIYGGGGFGFGGGNRAEGMVTESALCNANNFTQLENSVGRINDNITNTYMGLQNGMSAMGYEALRNTNALAMQTANGFAENSRQMSECCCTTQRGIDAVNYNVANQAAAINANTTAQIQKVLDAICADKIGSLQSQVNQLQLQSALCGVVRYPQYVTTGNPFGNAYCCNNL